MPQTQKKPAKKTVAKNSAPRAAPAVAKAGSPPGEVLTLAEAAAYLRLPEAEVVHLVHRQDLPGRFAGTEWRFLKSAIQDWLRTPLPRPSKEAVLSRIGSWKDDPYVEEELEEIYKLRRPATEEKA